MKLAECRSRELAYRDDVGPRNWVWGLPQWNTVCPRSNIPEIENTT
jgi:hypothetical protein